MCETLPWKVPRSTRLKREKSLWMCGSTFTAWRLSLSKTFFWWPMPTPGPS